MSTFAKKRLSRGEWIVLADRAVLAFARMLNHVIVAGVLAFLALQAAQWIAGKFVAWWLS